MPRDRITLNRDQAPLAMLALARLIDATIPRQPGKPKEATPELTLEQLQLAVQAHARIIEQLEAE